MEYSRRDFFKGASFVAAGAAAAGLVGCAKEEEAPKPLTIAESTVWADKADIVIVGMGAAALSAACVAGLENLGSTIVLEASPENLAGGNSVCCGQTFFAGDSAADVLAYQLDCNKPYEVESDVMKVLCDELYNNLEWLTKNCNVKVKASTGKAEFPEADHADKVRYYTDDGHAGDGGIWKKMHTLAEEKGSKLLYDSRVTKLIVDENNLIIGVSTEDGKNYMANKGVILACGGFEFDIEELNSRCAAGMVRAGGKGTTYNRGDGIRMCKQVGAKIWNMTNCSGLGFHVRTVDPKDSLHVAPVRMKTHDYIYLGPEGKRFKYEEVVYGNNSVLTRHGKEFRGGVWVDSDIPAGAYMVFGQDCYDSGICYTASYSLYYRDVLGAVSSCADLEKKGIIKKANTIADLAKNIGMDEATVAKSIETYNNYVAAGKDPEFHRGEPLTAQGKVVGTAGYEGIAASLAGFELKKIEAPYYSTEMIASILNTQGGPKRTAKNEVLDENGTVIPRLYAAGELGCPFVYKYNTGGNFAEAIASGRVAVRALGALKAWNVVEEEKASE